MQATLALNRRRNIADVNETDVNGRSLLYHAYYKPEILKRLLLQPNLKRQNLAYNETLLSRYEIFPPSHPQFKVFAEELRMLAHRFSLHHSIEIMGDFLSLGGISKKISMPAFFDSIEDFLPHCQGDERKLWEKTLEICKWGFSHENNIDELIVKAPYNIIAYTAVYETEMSAHEVSLSISKTSQRFIFGNRNKDPYGLQGFDNVSFNKLGPTIQKSLTYYYKGGDRFLKKIINKLKKNNPNFIGPHKNQKGKNCPIVAAKLLFRSVIMHLLMDDGLSWNDANRESYKLYKKWTRFDRLRAIQHFLKHKEKIDQIAQELSFSRYDLMQEQIVIEPLLEQIFHKCVSHGLTETLPGLLPYSDFKKDPNRILFNAYLNNPQNSYPWILSQMEQPTPLSNFLKDLDPKNVKLTAFLRKNSFLILKMSDPDCLVQIYFEALQENLEVLLKYLKQYWLFQIPNLEDRIKKYLENKFLLEGSNLSTMNTTLVKIFKDLDLKNPYKNPIKQ